MNLIRLLKASLDRCGEPDFPADKDEEESVEEVAIDTDEESETISIDVELWDKDEGNTTHTKDLPSTGQSEQFDDLDDDNEATSKITKADQNKSSM